MKLNLFDFLVFLWFMTGFAVLWKWGFLWVMLGMCLPFIPFAVVPYFFLFG